MIDNNARASVDTSHTSTCVRSAYTLLEMLIVCAILAAIAGLSWPTVRGSLAKGRLKKAASDVRTTLVRTRNDAIRKGSTLAVQYEMNGRRYRIQQQGGLTVEQGDESFAATDFTSTAVSTNDVTTQEDEAEWIEKELPVGVRFTSIDNDPFDSEDESFALSDNSITAENTSSIAFDAGTGEIESADWSEPIVFHANGRTENAALRLMNDRDFFIDLQLRGLTGIVTSTPPARMRLPEQSDEFLGEEAGSFEASLEASP